MNKINKLLLASICLAMTFASSCSLDTENYQDIPTEDAYKTVKDVENAMTGAYWALGTYRFYGKNIVAIGDMCADISIGSASSGHYNSMSTYAITETAQELDQVWEYGYKLLDRSVRTIAGGKNLVNAGVLSDVDKSKVELYIAQCYGLKALGAFTLVNVFGLPYHAGRDNIGIPLLKDTPYEAQDKVERATVGEVYDLVLEDIKNAKEAFKAAFEDELSKSPSAFYMNEAALYALEARVLLHMKDLTGSKAAAEKALALAGSKEVGDAEYLTMWSSLAISDEDIFTISKTEDDNLSANSLNTLYGSYRGSLVNGFDTEMFGSKDIRKSLIVHKTEKGDKVIHPMKFDGTASSDATSNIPVFRKSEMYLILAEIEAINNNIPAAQKALFYTAKRDKDILNSTQLPANKADLLKFISAERKREFFQEGYRFYEARRTSELIDVANGINKNFDVAKFVFPIPANEVNAGKGVIQTKDWSLNLPK